MQTDPIFQKVFRRVYGLPGWRVSPGWGSFLTFEFGEPHLDIREPSVPKGNVSEKVRKLLARRHVSIKGDWHLWINCCEWSVLRRKKLIGKSTWPSTYQKAADFLDGQKLVRFSLLPKETRCIFEFDLGGRLETRPYDRHSHQWLFFDKRIQQVLVLRADGNYSYGPSKSTDQEKWKPVQIP
jgi:hypothetical protein